MLSHLRFASPLLCLPLPPASSSPISSSSSFFFGFLLSTNTKADLLFYEWLFKTAAYFSGGSWLNILYPGWVEKER